MEYKIRLANSDDILQIQAVKPDISKESIMKRLEKQRTGDLDFLVLEVGQKLVSFVLLKWSGKPSHTEYPDIEDLYTKEDERKKGYARKLLQECFHHAVQRGYRKIGLAVNPEDNKMALNYYKRLGFVHDGRKPYLDGVYNGVEDWVIDLEKDLKAKDVNQSG